MSGRIAGAPRLRRNIAANYVGKLWGIASVYVFIPVYIKLLGISGYGLVAFYSMALGVLFIADAGLSSAFSREVARGATAGDLPTLLRSVERVLLTLLSTAGLAMALFADLLASRWLNSTQALGPGVAAQSIRFMAVALVPQLAMSLYFGGLMGLQRQVRANALYTAFGAVRSGLVIVPIFFFRDPRVFFAWQAVVAWSFLAIMRHALKRAIGATGAARFSWEALRSIYKFAAGMFAMSVISGLNTQLDRLVVSALRPIGEFAYYTLGATLAQGPTIASLPIAVALLPRFTALVERRHARELAELYERNSFVVAAIASAGAFALVFFASDVARLWTRLDTLPESLPTVIRMLAVGGLFLALQLLPYQLALAHGHTRTNVLLGSAFLVVGLPAQYLLTRRFGLLGAAVPWIVLNAVAFVYLGVILNWRFHDGPLARWFGVCAAVPAGVTGGGLWASRLAADVLGGRPLPSCAIAGCGALLSLAACQALWPRLKRPELPARGEAQTL